MAKSHKKVEVLQIEVLHPEQTIPFGDILTCSDVVEREFSIKGKDVSLIILEQSRNAVVGLVETSRKNNIPPKKDGIQKKVGKLGLLAHESLAYANVFHFDKKSNILMYEVNKNGCYVDHFVEYIYKCCAAENSDFRGFAIGINPVLKSDSYERMMNMSMQKSLEFTLANPAKILEAYRHKNEALRSIVANAQNIHSNKVSVKFDVEMTGKKRTESRGLASKTVREFISDLFALKRGPAGDNVRRIKITGYEQDSDHNRSIELDLLTERMIEYIELDEPRENVDLLENQRKTQIKLAYTRCKEELGNILTA